MKIHKGIKFSCDINNQNLEYDFFTVVSIMKIIHVNNLSFYSFPLVYQVMIKVERNFDENSVA